MESGATSDVSGTGRELGIPMTREWKIDDGQKVSVLGFIRVPREDAEGDVGRPSCFPSGRDGGFSQVGLGVAAP